MELLANIARNSKKMSKVGTFEDEYAVTVEYGIETESKMLKVWNSSNQESFNHESALSVIADELEDGETEGEFDDGNFNTICWEVTEK